MTVKHKARFAYLYHKNGLTHSGVCVKLQWVEVGRRVQRSEHCSASGKRRKLVEVVGVEMTPRRRIQRSPCVSSAD